MKKKIYKSLTAIILASTMVTGMIQTPITSYASIVKAADETQNVSEREQLKKLIEKADKLNESDYTAESWAEFKDVRDSIEDVDEIPDQYVVIVLQNLQEAIDNLEPAKAESEERKQLKALIEKADKLNESDYTAESWAEFKEVRDAIEDVDAIPDKYVSTVLQNLQDAMDGLKKAEDNTKLQLDDGYYIVNLTCGMFQKGNLLGKYSTGGISETALITAKNHKYTVTMSAANGKLQVWIN